MRAAYERGMKISYDPESRQVTVTFRGRVITLNGEFDSERDAVNWGEDYCRRNGWSDKPAPTATRSMLKPRTYNL